MKSLFNSVVLLKRSIFICLFFMPFMAHSDTAQNYEKALISFNQEKFRDSYIHLKNALQETPGHLPSKLLIGRVFLIDGNPDAAITEFEEVVLAGADSNLVTLPLANAYLMKGQFKKIVDLDIPRNASQATQLDITLLKANAYIQLDNYILAQRQFHHAKSKFGNEIRVINGLAQIALLNKNLIKAREIINQALAINSKNGQSKLLSGLIYQADKQYNDALTEFETAYQNAPEDPAIKRALANSYAQLGSISKAQKIITEIETQSPGSLQTKLLKARLLAMSEKNKEADIVLSELSQTLSLLNKTDKQYVSKVSLVAAITAHLNQNYDVSIRELSRYLNHEEPTAELIAMLAEGYIRTNKYKLATRLLEQHESLILNNIQVASLSCDLYLSSNKVFKCDSLVKQLKQIHGEAHQVLLLEAKLLNSRKRPQDALNILQTKLAENSNPETILFRTTLLASLGKYKESLIDAQLLLISSPQDLTYLNLNIDLLIRLEDFEQANTLLKKVLQQNPENLAGLVHQSRIQFSAANLQGAQASIQKVLSIDKSNFSALLLSGQISIKQNNLSVAIDQLIAAKTVNASSTSPRELLVSVYKQQNKLDLAISELNQLLKLNRLEPNYIHEKAKLYIALKQPEKAENELDLLFFQWTKEPKKLVQLSRLQTVINDVEGAELSLKEAQKQAPNYLEPQLEYTNLLLGKKEFLKASTHIKNLQKKFPNNANVNLVNGHYFKEIGELDNAYLHYNKAYTLSTNFTAALIELYKIANQNIHSSDVINTFEQLIKSQPEDHFNRHLYADLLFTEGEISEASKHYEKLILIDDLPNKANIYNNLANIMSNNDLVKAMFYANKAANLKPNSSFILDTLGWLHTKDNNPEQGLDILRQAFTLNSESPTTRYHLAYTLNQLGRIKEAKSELLLALDSDQEFQERGKAQALLLEL